MKREIKTLMTGKEKAEPLSACPRLRLRKRIQGLTFSFPVIKVFIFRVFFYSRLPFSESLELMRARAMRISMRLKALGEEVVGKRKVRPWMRFRRGLVRDRVLGVWRQRIIFKNFLFLRRGLADRDSAFLFPTTSSPKAFSLIEILIALTIISFMVMLSIPTVNRIFQTDLRSSVRQVAVLTRAMYNEAILKKKLFRLAIDLDENKYWAEMSPSNSLVYLQEEGKEVEEDESFNTFEKGFMKYEDQFIKEKSLPTGVVFRDVVNEIISPQPKTGGRAYIFFYPRGEVDPALIRIAHDRPNGVIYTIELLPVSGNTRFYAGYTGFGGQEVVR